MWFILLLATHEQFFILEGSVESNEISWKCCLCNLNRTHFFGREQFIPNRDEKGKASLDDGKCSSRFLTFETYFDHVISKFTRAPGIHPRAPVGGKDTTYLWHSIFPPISFIDSLEWWLLNAPNHPCYSKSINIIL